MQSASLRLSDFHIRSELGHGSSGTVFKVQHKSDGGFFVIKQVPVGLLSSRQEREALKEVNILRQLSHPHIIQYYGSWVEKNTLCILMEYAEGGDLHRLIRTRKERKRHLVERDVWRYAGELVSAVAYLHAKGVVHRDIKPMNVLLTKDNHVKLADLGASKLSRETALHVTRIGTPLFLAPELVKQTPYDSKVDVWAVGCVLYHLATLDPPFRSENLLALGHAIVHKQPKPLPSGYSEKLSALVFWLLEKRPSARPTISEVAAALPEKPKDSDSHMESLATEMTLGRSIKDGANEPKPQDQSFAIGSSPSPGLARPIRSPSVPRPSGAVRLYRNRLTVQCLKNEEPQTISMR